MIPEPLCPYCGKKAALVTGETVYPHRPDLKEKRFWLCKPCDAWVGTHPNNKHYKPLGRLANKELRTLKIQAHAAFDPLWKGDCVRSERSMHRSQAYKWLAHHMGIHPSECHIGMFNEEQCRLAIRICGITGIGNEAEKSNSEKSFPKE